MMLHYRLHKTILALCSMLLLSSLAYSTEWTVELVGLDFVPADLAIAQGDTVRWVNTGGFHNVVEQSAPPLFDSGNPTSDLFTFTFVFAGVELATYDYVCEVHEAAGMTGTITVQAGPPENDACINAIDILEGETGFSTLEATNGDDIADLPLECDEGFGLQIVHDIWFIYRASITGTATFSTCGIADFDTRVACYTQNTPLAPPCPLDNQHFHACNDDGIGCPDFTSILEFPCEEGIRYLIRLGGLSNPQDVGSGIINLSAAPDPVPEIDVIPDSLDFGSVPIDSLASLTFEIHNTGMATLIIDTIFIESPFAVDLTTASIPANEHLSVTVDFIPVDTGEVVGIVHIFSNASAGPSTVSVAGRGDLSSSARDNPMELVRDFYTIRNYPNPFNPSTSIRFDIPHSAPVRLSVFNLIGREVTVLHDGMLNAGHHLFDFDGADFTSGIYIARLQTSSSSSSAKLILLK